MGGHNWGKCSVKRNVATTKMKKKMEKAQEANVMTVALGNDCRINNDDSFISDGKLMAEVCCFEQDTNLIEIATDAIATGMSASNDSPQEHIHVDESVTHHLNELTLDAFKHEVNTNILSPEFIDVFTRFCDDNYSLVSDVLLHSVTFHSHKY
jgi:hypothetical protein